MRDLSETYPFTTAANVDFTHTINYLRMPYATDVTLL